MMNNSTQHIILGLLGLIENLQQKAYTAIDTDLLECQSYLFAAKPYIELCRIRLETEKV